jgi:alpha-L-rhamnosidase
MTTSRRQAAGRTTYRRALAAGASVLAAALLMTPAAAGAAVRTGGPLPSWPASPDWQQYVEAPGSANLTPVRVVSVSGTVTNPGAVVAGGRGDTTLTRSAGDTGPTDIVLDYGRDIGGIPSFTVAAASGSPTMEAGYSEAAEFIAPGGDGGTPTIGANGDPSRADSYTVSGPGVITNRYIQGGERYQEISLTSAGSVSLSSVGIRYTAYDGTPRSYRGYFVSSDPTFNQAWYAGAYTLNLAQDLAGTQSHQWAISNGAMNLTARSSFIGTPTNNGVLRFGGTWRDYTSAFTADIVSGQVSWSVRARDDLDQYAITLSSSAASASPDSVVIAKVSHGVSTTLGTFTTPFAIAENQAYRISTTVSGQTITVSINGTVIGSVSDATFAAGTVGFGESGTGSANVSHLAVTAPGGTPLYISKLAAPSALTDFLTPGTPTVDLILDGAKRDRATFTGDLSVAAQTLYDTNDATAFVKGSLDLLGSTQLTSGYVSPFAEPGAPSTGGLIPGEISVPLGIYSLYFVSDVGDYYTYTGDREFVAQEWPTVQREMAWELAQANSDGLFVTTPADDLNWNIESHDGVVTFYNALYYKTLTDAAQLAGALGHSSLAAQYAADAARVKAQINAQLYDPSTQAYDISTTDRGSIAQDANSAVIRYGIAPASRQAGILAAMTKALGTPHGDLSVSSPVPAGSTQIISPFVGSSDLDARFAAGDTAGAFQLLRDEWGPMTTGPDGGTMWEKLAPDGTIDGGGTSLAHAWSTGPTSALTSYVLGVTPASPGYATWQVAPQPGSLGWAEGAVPTPHGDITVKWAASAAGFAIAVGAPAGTTGTVVLPKGAGRYSVTVNGNPVPVTPGQAAVSVR